MATINDAIPENSRNISAMANLRGFFPELLNLLLSLITMSDMINPLVQISKTACVLLKYLKFIADRQKYRLNVQDLLE